MPGGDTAEKDRGAETVERRSVPARREVERMRRVFLMTLAALLLTVSIAEAKKRTEVQAPRASDELQAPARAAEIQAPRSAPAV